MPITDPVLYIVLASFVGLLAWAALTDIRSFTIPNRINLAILALYPAYVLVSPVAVDWKGGLTCGLIAFGMGAFMFAMRWIGGGDVKMMAVAAVWAGPALIFEMVVIVCVIGGLHSIIEGIRGGYPVRYWRLLKGFVANLFNAKLATNEAGGSADKPVFVPYGVAIFAGGLFVAGSLLKTHI